MIFGRNKNKAPVSRLLSATGSVQDTSRKRGIAWIACYMSDSKDMPVIILSHGGEGNANGYKESLKYIREALASAGYLAISIQHNKSKNIATHLIDRPADCSFFLSQLLVGKVALKDFSRSKIGHVGHSYGSYTGLALAGCSYDQGTFGDDRFEAFVSLSPQGPGEFGSTSKTWDNLIAPVYFISGTREDNKNGSGWRKIPFLSSPSEDIKFWSLVYGMDHNDLGKGGSKSQSQYVSSNVVAFFDWYFKEGDYSKVGTLSWINKTEISNSADE